MTTNDYFVHESKRLDWSYQYIIFYLHAIPPAKNLLPPAQKPSPCSLEMPHKSSTVLAPVIVCVYISVWWVGMGECAFSHSSAALPTI